MSGMEAAINGEGVVTSASDWILARVRLELWEVSPERTCYVDTIEINGVTYTIEPGGTAPAMSLSSPYREVGYTEDGVILTYTATTVPIRVEEETIAVDDIVDEEMVEVTCNMAENTLANMALAMAGAALSGNILTIGAGVNKYLNLKIEGVTPAGYLRAVHVQKCSATGAVAQSYKKNEKTVIPVTFRALKTTGVPAVTVVDNAA